VPKRQADLSALIAPIEELLQLDVQQWRDLGGSRTTNLALVTRDGSTVVARVHAASTTPARVVAEQAVRRELAAAGLPTVTAYGLHPLTDGRLVELEPYVDAHDQMNTPARLSAGYRLLAQLHDVMRRSTFPPAAAQPPHANHVHARDALRLTRAGVERVLGWADHDLHRFALAVADHIAQVDALERPLDSAQVRQLVHGDYWDNNVLFTNDQPTAVLDFGFMGRRARIDDLALPFWFWVLEPGHDIPGPEKMELLARLADAYDSGTDRPLSSHERAALPLAVARQPAWSIGRWIVELDEAAAIAHARAARAELPAAQAILAALPDWQQTLARAV
jgi:Ser/Thr protein kinase RdoA (MazF antagonist)